MRYEQRDFDWVQSAFSGYAIEDHCHGQCGWQLFAAGRDGRPLVYPDVFSFAEKVGDSGRFSDMSDDVEHGPYLVGHSPDPFYRGYCAVFFAAHLQSVFALVH